MHALPRTFVTPTMALVVVVAFAGGALAQPAPPDFSKVQIKTTKISGNFYTLEGQGGVIGVLAGPDGVFMSIRSSRRSPRRSSPPSRPSLPRPSVFS
jgi:hypothetical protein